MLDGLGIDRKRIAGFLPTQHEGRPLLSRDQLDDLASLDVPVVTPIPNSVAAAEAPLAGEAVTTRWPGFSSHSTIAQVTIKRATAAARRIETRPSPRQAANAYGESHCRGHEAEVGDAGPRTSPRRQKPRATG